MLVQAAWAHFNDGKRPDAQDALRRAFAGSPDLEVVADFFSPEFVKLAGDVRAAALAAMPPPVTDLNEMKRVAKEKLADGNTEDVIHDFLYNVPREKLDAEALDLLAQAYERQGKFTEAAKVRASAGGPQRLLPQRPPVPGRRPAASWPCLRRLQHPRRTTPSLFAGKLSRTVTPTTLCLARTGFSRSTRNPAMPTSFSGKA